EMFRLTLTPALSLQGETVCAADVAAVRVSGGSPLTPALSPSEGERESGGAVGCAMASPWPFDDLRRQLRGLTASDSPSPPRRGRGPGLRRAEAASAAQAG